MHAAPSTRFAEIVSCAAEGYPLPTGLRHRMEALFNADFAAVRVHLNNRITEYGALALAHGDNVFLPDRLADPDSPGFGGLLAHELTHVLQQREGRIAGDQPDTAVVADAALEGEADLMVLTHDLVVQAGLHTRRNRVARRPATTSTLAVQCVMLHSHDAIRKVDWLSGKNKLLENQVEKAKKIILQNKDKGVDSLSVTGLDGRKKFGHESTGSREANPTSNSVSVWWKQAFGRPLKDAHGNVVGRNTLDDAISVCGLGTHVPEYKGDPAYRLHWRVDSGLADRFFISSNTVKLMPVPKDD